MNCYLCTLLCLFVTIFPLCSSLRTITPIGLSPVPDICRDITKTNPKSINYDFCVSQLQSDSRALTASVSQISEISFNLTISKAMEMTYVANVLLKDQTLDLSAKNVYLNCSSFYKRKVVVYLEGAVEALRSGDLKTTKSRVNSAINETTTCEEGIKGFEKVSVSLIRLDYEFYQLAQISLGLINLLRVVN